MNKAQNMCLNQSNNSLIAPLQRKTMIRDLV